MITTTTHILLQNKTKPPRYHVTTTHHNSMLPYTKQQSQQVHTNPSMHQCMRILFLPESHKSLEPTPPEIIKASQHYTHSNKPTAPSTLLLQPTSPDSSLTSDTETVFNLNKLLHLFTRSIVCFKWHNKTKGLSKPVIVKQCVSCQWMDDDVRKLRRIGNIKEIGY